MAYATLATYSEVLKTFYLPAIQEQLNHGTILSDLLDVNEEDISGKDAKIECHYGRSSGTGARADGASLPTATYQKYITATVPMKYIYGRIYVTGPTMAATRDERGAYAKALDSEIRGITRDLKMEVNRMLWGCGWGMVARWHSGDLNTALNCPKKYRDNSAGGDGFGTTFGGKYLTDRGDAVFCVVSGMSGTSATYTVGTSSIAATAVSKSRTDYDVVTCGTDAGNPAEGDWFVRPASFALWTASGNAQRLEMMGLRGIVTDQNMEEIMLYDKTNTPQLAGDGLYVDSLQGLSSEDYSWWQAQVDIHASGRYKGQRALTLNLMDTMFDKTEEIAGKDYGPDLILTTRPLRREYTDLCRADRRFVNTMTLDGGWKAIDYNGIPFTVDNDAIDGEIHFLTTKDLQIYRMSDYDWMDKDGSIMSRISGVDAYEAILFRYAELGCRRRNSQGVLCDLAYTV
jgi:hypothetical protein